ncbi:hypothetical protein QYE76_053105 [Lolium multiflorum]|uniref:Reverse transcriptase Ty1/copia-type domain-containing protein n=1 Tax=Lolium multiflorum TaxID=4521 RepID=A0AAD8WK42_LOLMU|nr:hypothetical protein QYE76_053105 [Lolium multiflorum]
MSMMGELKFFLGFQVRQLAKGTFISQEKYVKDMLKKFDMTNANPMKTPMPVKGQLGSCDGEKDVDIKHPAYGPVNRPARRVARSTGFGTGSPGLPSDDWSGEDRGTVAKRGRPTGPPPRRTSSRVPPQAPRHTGPGSSTGRIKKVGNKRKDKQSAQDEDVTEIVPNFNVGAVTVTAWRRIRDKNPYRFPEPTYLGSDKFFWTITQQHLWEDYYNSQEHMKNGTFVMPKAIKDVLTLHEATKYRFVVATLRRM